MELKTGLYNCHLAAGGKMVPFAGFMLPVQYESGIIAEHNAVRTKAGIFDVSHMGEIFIEGEDALNNLNNILTNDFTDMADGQARYTLMCNIEGGTVDDLLVYRISSRKYMLVLNAANCEKDIRWIYDHLSGSAVLSDVSAETGLIALQGPCSEEILWRVTDSGNIPGNYYHFIENGKVAGVNCLISRTGYTGEKGFELYMPADKSPLVWNALLKAGKPFGLIPCGLGARDTLRLEAAMPLYGHELSETITPLEAGLRFAVKMNKEDFIGKSALKSNPDFIRVGLKMNGKGVARENTPLYAGEKQIGIVTSGTYAPFLKYPVAMARIDARIAEIHTKVEADVRGRRIVAEVVPMPFYIK